MTAKEDTVTDQHQHPARAPKDNDAAMLRVYKDLWVPATITRVDAHGFLDLEDDDGGLWGMGPEQYLTEWRFAEDPRPELTRVQTQAPITCSRCGHRGRLYSDMQHALVLHMLCAGARMERARIVAIVRRGWAFPEDAIAVIEATDISPEKVAHLLTELGTPAPDALPPADELDRLRVQLAGCLVAAEGGTSDAQVAHEGDFGWSLAYQKVLDLRRAYDALTGAAEPAEPSDA